ncbi:hypothetical protein [Ruthenibacterium lactatiformans]|uniref:rolling circle replication-associated protein n=1 Tax=Ruthenibacterium lactatiformans TaxID=1550024 RepID=UPI001065B03C|nr:hypothetical protein [Ruthenibacterium lactatiformans]
MEVEIYPEFTKLPAAIPRKKNTAAQKDLNDRNSQKECVRTINENFGPRDLWCTFTYRRGCEPLDYNEALNNMRNYIRRIQRRRKRLGLPPTRYVGVIEWQEDEEKGIRCHHHVFFDGAMSMEEVEKLWGLGDRNELRKLDYDENALNGVGFYTTKAPRGRKKWISSVGLRKAVEKKSYTKFSAAAVGRMAKDRDAIRTAMEKKFPGYWYLEGNARANCCNKQFYISARLLKKAELGDEVTVQYTKLEGMPVPPITGRFCRVTRLYTVETPLGPQEWGEIVDARGRRHNLPARALIKTGSGRTQRTKPRRKRKCT